MLPSFRDDATIADACSAPCAQGDTIRRAVLRDVLVAEDVSPLCASSNPYRRDLEEAVTATRLAARLCTLVQQELTAGERQDKSDDSPVTVADYGAQALVAWALQKAFPGECPIQRWKRAWEVRGAGAGK